MIWIQQLGLGTYRETAPRSPYRRIRLRQGSHADLVTRFVPAAGEPAWATDRSQLFVGDGSAVGGRFVGAGGICSLSDAVGLEVVTYGAGATVVTYDTETELGPEFSHAAGVVTIGTPGWYAVRFQGAAAMVASHAISSLIWSLEVDAGGGFAASGIADYSLHISTAVTTFGASLTGLLELAAGDDLRVTVAGHQSGGSPSYATVPGSPHLFLQRVQ